MSSIFTSDEAVFLALADDDELHAAGYGHYAPRGGAGYRDNSGIEHESYDAACRYYGADTPEQCEAEERYFAAEESIATQDAMEARGGPIYRFWGQYLNDDIPF